MHNNFTVKTVAAFAIIIFTLVIVIYEGMARLFGLLKHELTELRNFIE